MLYVTLVLCSNDFSNTLLDLFTHVADVLREKHTIDTSLNVVYDDKCVDPLMIINDYEPVTLDRLPSLESLINMFLAIVGINNVSTLINKNYVEAEA